MKTKTIFTGAILLIASFAEVKAQQVIFPVVFHVLYVQPQQNLPDSVLQHQLDVLNEDYNASNPDLVNVPTVWQPIIGNMNIGFQFATVDPQGNPTNGIERRAVTSGYTPHSFAAGGLDPWPDSAYLNIWVYNIPNGILAYSAFPYAPGGGWGMDISCYVVGRNDVNQSSVYNQGRIATHELAHFFGLKHIWGDDNGQCTGSDSIADTPNQGGETFGNPGVGTVLTDACSPAAPGIMWMNFLDFTDDAGMCFFTQGQADRADTMIDMYYSSFRLASGIRNPVAAVSRYSVFPSPSSTGLFRVNRSEYNSAASVEVYDLQGRMILAPAYFENGSTTLQIDLSASPNGIYSVVIRSGEVEETKLVVIAR
jgi:hypothetical protein